MKGFCTGVGWREDGLAFELRGNEKVLHHVKPGDELAFAFVGTRSCIGSRPPGSESLIPCPDEITGINTSTCKSCDAKNLLLPCHICSGERCGNPARRSDCVQPKNHAVYLASFGNGMVKVGVARWNRRVERVSEQGARIALIVARDDGQSVRRIESAIKRCGVRDRYNPAEKHHAYSRAASDSQMRDELERVLDEMHRRVDAAWLDEPEYIKTGVGVVSTPPDHMDIHDGAALRGVVENIFGLTLIVRADNNSLIALEGKDLSGWELRELESHEASTGQISLQLAL